MIDKQLFSSLYHDTYAVKPNPLLLNGFMAYNKMTGDLYLSEDDWYKYVLYVSESLDKGVTVCCDHARKKLSEWLDSKYN